MNHVLLGSRLLAYSVALFLIIQPQIADAQCQMTLLQPPDVKAGDFYGSSIYFSGGRLIVGAPGGDPDDPHEGYADIYHLIDDEWVFQARITQPIGRPTDKFGTAVMIIDGILFITAPGYFNYLTGDNGAVYTYFYQDDKWKLIGIGSGDSFGFGPVSMASYSTLAVIGHNALLWGPAGGVVYIYNLVGAKLNLLSILTPEPCPRNCGLTQYGSSVDIVLGGSPSNTHRVVVGSPFDTETGDFNTSGAVHIYEYRSLTEGFVETAKLLAPLNSFGFGTTVAASQNRVFVTQRNYVFSKSAVSVYRIDNDKWALEQILEFPNYRFDPSPSLAVDNTLVDYPTMLIGSIECIRPQTPVSECLVDVGKVYAFDQETQQWAPKVKLRYDGIDTLADNSTVAWLDRDFAILGFPRLDDPYENAGAVLVFNGLSGNDNNNNGLPDACDIPGDASGDGLVNVSDLLILLGTWGPCNNCPADIDADGNVGILDLITLLGNWN